MESHVTIWELIILLGAAQGGFLSVVFLAQRRGNLLAKRILGVLLLVFSLRLLEIAAFWTKYLLLWPHFWTTTFALPYLFGPLLYLYIANSASKNNQLTGKTLAHFVPFLFVFVAQIPFFTLSADLKREYLANFIYSQNDAVSSTAIVATFVFLLQLPHLAIYTFFTLRRLKPINLVPASKSQHVLLKTNWLWRLTFGFCCLFCLWLTHAASLNFGFPYIKWFDYAAVYGMTFGIYAIGYTAISQPEIHTEINGDAGPKYQKSTLSPKETSAIVGRIVEIMRQKKPWLENDLRLPKLAKIVGIPTHHLSQVINEQFDLNFFDFVNGYRVEEAKKLILDERTKHFTFLRIAYDVGFNNKTSFNSAFRKHTGMTPSEFRRNNDKPA